MSEAGADGKEKPRLKFAEKTLAKSWHRLYDDREDNSIIYNFPGKTSAYMLAKSVWQVLEGENGSDCPWSGRKVWAGAHLPIDHAI